jgi:4-hydroxybenzoate polyprenyltransferase
LDHGVILAALLLTAGLGGAALVSGAFFAVLLLYVVVTLAYSTLLKPLLMLDVVALAGLHALRVFAGGIAAGVTVSSWLLTLSIFLFLCLAIVKRHAELSDRRRAGARTAPGRGYTTDDLPVLAALGGAAGCSAVVVLALYIQSPEVKALYATPDILWAVCPILLYWISRALLLSGRDAMQDDPVLFALRDPVSLACGALVGIAAWLAS